MVTFAKSLDRTSISKVRRITMTPSNHILKHRSIQKKTPDSASSHPLNITPKISHQCFIRVLPELNYTQLSLKHRKVVSGKNISVNMIWQKILIKSHTAAQEKNGMKKVRPEK